MQAHAHDLRSEVDRLEGTLRAEAFVEAVLEDWRRAGLAPADAALCEYAEKLTRAPAECGAADVAALRARGLDDRAIHDAVQVIAYFNYINRVAEALGTDPEDFYLPRGAPAGGGHGPRATPGRGGTPEHGSP